MCLKLFYHVLDCNSTEIMESLENIRENDLQASWYANEVFLYLCVQAAEHY